MIQRAPSEPKKLEKGHFSLFCQRLSMPFTMLLESGLTSYQLPQIDFTKRLRRNVEKKELMIPWILLHLHLITLHYKIFLKSGQSCIQREILRGVTITTRLHITMGHYSASTQKYPGTSRTPDGQRLSFLQKVTWIIPALREVLGSM